MAVSNTYRTTERYRITLEVCVEDDFNPQQIDWRKVLNLQENESVNSYTEALSIPVRY